MPRPTYGPEPKRRTAQLFGLLLDYANDELALAEAQERELEGLRSHIQTRWQTDRCLVVRTKVRSLQALSKLVQPEKPLTPEQVKEALRRLDDYLEILHDHRPNASGSETWHFSLQLWCGRRDRPGLLHRFEQEWEQRRPLKSKARVDDLAPVPTSPLAASESKADDQPPSDRWLQWCHDCLYAQNVARLTTNPLTLQDGLTFQWQSLYVPLGVSPRLPMPEIATEDPTTDSGTEIPVLSPDTFLSKLLNHPQRCRIAIVGEPGSGKTTLLQKLAWDLLAQQQIPIWISLADLQGITLEQFILGDWLKLASRQLIVSPDLQQNLAEQVQQGRVWLLLDAVDEMALDSSVALAAIARQLRGWLWDAQVVLTCRTHVWDSGKNNLTDFESYSNLTFTVAAPEQTDQFIRQWFFEQPALGECLSQELAKTKHHRIRDTVQNPLRLALLCRAWSRHQGFPQTKSRLYQQFVDALYDWKQDCLPTTLGQRQQLNQALGELAIAALLHPQTKFRLPQHFVFQVWGEHTATLLPLALTLGWLIPINTVSVSGETLYAFSHPTFQEYFAAQAITVWQSCLGSDWLAQLIEPQWREILLFWLGRSGVALAPKEAVIQALLTFPDEAGGGYRYRAYCLAAEGLAEFPESAAARLILAQLMQWQFGYYDAEQSRWQWPPPPLQAASQAALMRTDRALAINTYEAYLQGDLSFFVRWHAAYSLGNALVPGHPLAIQVLRDLLTEAQGSLLQIRLCTTLARVNPGDPLAIETLLRILQQPKTAQIHRKAAHCLGRIVPGCEVAIATLADLAQTAAAPVNHHAAESLGQLAPHHPLATVKAIEQHPRKRRPAPRGERPEASIAQEIDTLAQKLQAPKHLNAQIQSAYRLGRLVPGHPQAIQALLQVLCQPDQDLALYRRAGNCLTEILTRENLNQVIATLRPLATPPLGTLTHTPQTLTSYRILWQLSHQLPYSAFLNAWQS